MVKKLLKLYLVFGLILIIGLSSVSVFASTAPASITVVQGSIQQGEPFEVVFNNVASTALITSLTFDGKSIGVFMYQSKPTAFIGIDLNKKPGVYVLNARLTNGTRLKKDITILARAKIEAPLGVPEKLGGNTPTAQKTVVDTLALENAVLYKLTTGSKAYWSKPFIFPVDNPIVTDPYGYLRQTGSYTISHKGTDFHALEGTPVKAMNRGVVRLTKTFTEYGNTVIIDHGLGLMTFYMHLSKINVTQGSVVTQGQIIGLSGQTGYADQPHLHLTVRINNTSIDPMKFMAFFK